MKERLSAPAGEIAINGWQRQRRNNILITKLHGLSKPTIAAVNGAAAGLGCDMAMACDFVIGSTKSSFIMSFVLRGLIPDGGGMYFLPRRVGLARAKEIIFSGRRIDVKEAMAIGMIDEIAPHDALLSTAAEYAKKMCEVSSAAIALSKSILDKSFEMSLEQVLALGCQAQAICYTGDDHHRSVEAFLNRDNNTEH
jgi:enoyl-CoA hydratase/carnithine racemase